MLPIEIELKNTDYVSIESYQNIDHCWRSDQQIENGLRTVVYKLFPTKNGFFSIIVNNTFDESLCNAILDMCDHYNLNQECIEKPVSLVEGLHVKDYPFDCIAIINHKVHGLFRYTNPELSKLLCSIIPINRCELTGNEDTSTIAVLIDGLIDSTNWKREIAPRIYMRYRSITGSKRKYLLYDPGSLKVCFDELTEGKNYDIEIYNFKEEYIKIFIKDEIYRITGPDKEEYFQTAALPETRDWVDGYLRKGLESVRTS